MELFKRLLRARSFQDKDGEVRNIIEHELDKLNVSYKTDEIGNIIVEKGNPLYPCFCCHMDTIHKITKKHKVREQKTKNDTLWTSPTGIGGDDKCGIWACLKLLQELQDVKVVFFAQEECGQIGANNIELEEFDDCCFICELDRLGNDDLIVDYIGMPTTSMNFEDDLVDVIPKKDKWELAEGFITDVMVLFERGIQISVMNMSCGYYHPHMKNEVVSWKDMNKMLRMARKVATLTDQIYVIENEPLFQDEDDDRYKVDLGHYLDKYSYYINEYDDGELLFRQDGTYVGSTLPGDN